MKNDYLHSMWPLKTNLPYSNSGGFHLKGFLDSSNFIEYYGGGYNFTSLLAFYGQNGDQISVHISSFETDNPLVSEGGIPSFQLMPCEELRISLALEHHTLINRSESLCRDDYSEKVTAMLKIPMTSDNFYNAAFSPRLPYDQRTCSAVCIANYWLPICGCFGSPEAWRYAGRPANRSMCPRSSELPFCTLSSTKDAPWLTIAGCECHQRCSGHRLRIVTDEKIQYSYGN